MDTEVMAVKLKEVEDRSKSNTHRLDDLEEIAKAIYSQNENIATLVIELKHTNEAIDRQEKRLEQMEHRPLDGLEEIKSRLDEMEHRPPAGMTELQNRLDDLGNRTTAIESRPGKLWDKLIFGILGAIATGIGAAVVALLIH